MVEKKKKRNLQFNFVDWQLDKVSNAIRNYLSFEHVAFWWCVTDQHQCDFESLALFVCVLHAIRIYPITNSVIILFFQLHLSLVFLPFFLFSFLFLIIWHFICFVYIFFFRVRAQGNTENNKVTKQLQNWLDVMNVQSCQHRHKIIIMIIVMMRWFRMTQLHSFHTISVFISFYPSVAIGVFVCSFFGGFSGFCEFIQQKKQ